MSLDIKPEIKTFEITVLILRLVSRPNKQGGILVMETLARVTALEVLFKYFFSPLPKVRCPNFLEI